jgi:hypothetical protein
MIGHGYTRINTDKIFLICVHPCLSVAEK